MNALPKLEVFQRLNFTSIEDMNIALMDVGEQLKAQGQEIPAELIKPEDFADISKEHLTLLRDRMQQALELALPEQASNNGAIAPTSSQLKNHDQPLEVAPGTLAGFRETLKQLGVEYVAKAAGYDISDSFFLALDKALAERNEQNLRSRLDGYRNEFDDAVESIKQTAQEREAWQKESLGKFSALANFSDLDEKLAAIQR